jgi:penicillin-binding protein 1A
VSDWNLDPYRFSEGEPRPKASDAPAPDAAPGPEAGPEATYRADLPRPKPVRTPKPPKPPKPPGRRFGGGGRGLGGPKPPRDLRILWIGLGALVMILMATAVIGYAYVQKTYLADMPPPPTRAQLFTVARAPAIRFFDKTGAFLAARGPKYGDRVTLSQLPAYVPQAFLAAEDRRFYHHGAVDPIGIARAAFANWRAGHVVQGGSTLAQQLAKSMFLTPDQTMKRKIQEAVMATRLEKALSKDEVLELYLNRTFFGANTFGVDGASRTYFGKPASQITIGEAALLASLPKAPSRMALNRNMGKALARQKLVLDNMLAEHWITREQEAQALARPPQLSATGLGADGDMGYALDYATSEVLKMVGPNSPDLMVRLTIDPPLQYTAGKVLRQVIQANGAAAGASQGALVAMTPDGAIRAMVGGLDYAVSVFNRAAQAKRQPGSSFKPFVYATAVEKGLLPTDVRVDGPVKLGEWSPENYGGGYKGPVTIETALALSINTVAVKVAQEVGGTAIGNLAHRFGLTTIPEHPDLAIALGAYEVPLVDMVQGFLVFANRGERVPPYMVDEIRTVAGASVFVRQAPAPVPATDINTASTMVRMMEKVVTGGTGTRANFGRPAAGKTGTSQNYRDAWFIGFTPDYVAGVWVGNDNEKPMNRVTGGILSAEVWRRFMMVAHARLPARNFDWLTPEPVAQTEADPRNAFYKDLANEFSASGRDAENDPVEGKPDKPPADDPPF